MFSGILILVIFGFFAALMARQKLSTFLCLLGMGLGIAIIGGMPLNGKDGILQVMFEAGSMKLGSSIAALILGAWLGEVMTETGITKDIIRRSSELAGDKPIILSIVLALVVGLLFTALTGLGSAIMVGTLVLPILTAAGVSPVIAAGIFLISRTMGLLFNLSQWQLYINITKLTANDIKQFATVAALVGVLTVIVFIFVELKFRVKKKVAWAVNMETAKHALLDTKKVPMIALITPIIPFPLVILLNWPIIPALFVGVLFGAFVTVPKDAFRVLTKTVHEAVKSAAPAIVLMVGIGMLLSVVGVTTVSDKLLPLFSAIMPSNAIGYALFFALLTPLALYRGPMNMWGLGSGVLALMCATKQLPVMALVAGFLAAQIIQLAGDPTNTHNVWSADFLGIEVNDITKKLFIYLWSAAILCVIIGTFMFVI